MLSTSQWAKRISSARWMQLASGGLFVVLIALPPQPLQSQDTSFQVMEATIKDVHDRVQIEDVDCPAACPDVPGSD